MARPATGQVVESRGKRDTVYALRFRAYGQRRYVTLGGASEGWNRQKAEQELANILADVRRGIWKPPVAETVEAPKEEPTFHQFASEWLEQRRPELGPRTYEDYKWSLSYHLLPYFASFRLSQITKRDVDAYKTHKLNEGILNANTINKTLTRLAQILELAAEYEMIPANPASGRRRRVKGTKPRRAWVEPEQLPVLLDVSEKLLRGRGRPLLATLAGAGLRIDEALSLEWRDVSLTRGTLTIRKSKTEAGVRTVDLTPALVEELKGWQHKTPHADATNYVFATLNGGKDNRHNVRRRLLVTAIEKANEELSKLKMGDREGKPARATPNVRVPSLRCRGRRRLHGGAARPHRPDVHAEDLHARCEAARPSDSGGAGAVQPGSRLV